VKTAQTETTFVAWITKYALTRGVYIATMIENNNGLASEVRGGRVRQTFRPSEFARDAGSAEIQFETLRTKKLASLDKAHKKIANLKFSVRDLRDPEDQTP
jgi:hypothetical protein